MDGLRSESKILVGQKRGSNEVDETSEKPHKGVKMRDLESVFRSEVKNTEKKNSNVAQAGKAGSKAHSDIYSDSRSLDLNIGVDPINFTVNDNDPTCVDESNNPPKKETKHKGFDLDLNAADISSSINHPFYKMNGHSKYRDDSDCGSSIDPFEKDPLSVWKGLKQNNFMSTTRSAIPMGIPKARGRKNSSLDVMKKKMELAKKEQVDKFARFAAPSGLLNELNPGIINHVRNSKQVHTIIGALVSSERDENLASRSKKHGQHRDGLLGRKEMTDYTLFSKFAYPRTEAGMKTFPVGPSQFENKNEDYRHPLKFSSSLKDASQNASCLSNEKSASLSSVTSLSSKAANVASQWLELLNQDIRGRLTGSFRFPYRSRWCLQTLQKEAESHFSTAFEKALRKSRKRVRQVINTDLPILMLSEFSSKDLHTKKGSSLCNFDQSNAEAHSVKWNNLFAQMDKALSEEESHLDNWLSQVKEMQLHCEYGLNQTSLYHSSQQMAPIGNNSRSGATDNSEKDLAVRAAAASIYSTCTFLLSRENQPCC